MASLKNIKLKILSYKKTGTVTHAMEAVSAVKMRKSQERALSGRTYAAVALTILERLAGTADMTRNRLTTEQKGKACYIVITSDKGLAGSLNSGIIRRVEQDIVKSGLDKKDIVMIAVGRRGGDYFANRGFDVRVKHENVADGVSEGDLRAVIETVLSWHRDGEIGTCFVAYTNFTSTFEQEPTVRQIVPITSAMIAQMVAGIRPAKGKYAPTSGKKVETKVAAYTIEPDADSIFSALLPKLLNIAVFHALLENKASEHSARMVAMKSATDKAKEMGDDLTRTFNKVRQAAITREVSEITSGIEAMK
jgi:F-type H+-transporting ATPase subunit gamma